MTYSKQRKIYITLSAIAVIAVMIIIFCLSAQVSDTSEETSGSFIAWIKAFLGIDFSQEVIRTLAHFCEYAGLGFLVTNLFSACKQRLMPIISAICSWAYAWTDEIHQIFVEGRAFQLSDLSVDLCGILLGTVVFIILIKFINILKNKKHISSH